jgi:hypothetical protein
MEIAVDVELKHHAGMVAGSARVEWLDADEAELVEIEPVDEHVDRTHRIVLSHVVVKQRRENTSAWDRFRRWVSPCRRCGQLRCWRSEGAEP